MGIRFYCPNGHKLNVKSFQAGRRGICPFCGVSVLIPTESIRPASGKKDRGEGQELRMQSASPPEAVSPTQPTLPTGTPKPVSPEPSPLQSAVQPVWNVPASVPVAPAAIPAAAAAAGPADPLAEAPNAVWYVRPAGGGQYGPATSDVMRTWLTEGRIGADSLVWREGWRDWKEASEVFSQLKPDALSLFVSGKAAATPTSSPQPLVRHKAGTSTSLIITILILAVIALFVVFLMVLFQQPQVEPEPKATPAAFQTSSGMTRATT